MRVITSEQNNPICVRFLEVPASMNIVFRNALFVQAYFCRIELPHYNYLKMLRTAIPFALSLAFPPVFHTLHFISGCPILSIGMEDELQITLTNDYAFLSIVHPCTMERASFSTPETAFLL